MKVNNIDDLAALAFLSSYAKIAFYVQPVSRGGGGCISRTVSFHKLNFEIEGEGRRLF